MAVLNEMDRFHLVGDAIDYLPQLGSRAAYVKQAMGDKLIAHRHYITRHGEDMPEIRHWQWGQYTTAATNACSPCGWAGRPDRRRSPHASEV